MSEPERWIALLHGHDWIVEREGTENCDDADATEHFIADCGMNDDYVDAEGRAKFIVADHNACLGIESPETTVPELVAVAKRASATCVCQATMSPDIQCLSCMARAVLAQTGKTR